MATARTYPPRPTEAVIRGIVALAKPETSAAALAVEHLIFDEHLPRRVAVAQIASPNSMTSEADIADVRAALDYAQRWRTWQAADVKRQLRATRIRTAKLRAKVAKVAK